LIVGCMCVEWVLVESIALVEENGAKRNVATLTMMRLDCLFMERGVPNGEGSELESLTVSRRSH
jgi:hypothetical protein